MEKMARKTATRGIHICPATCMAPKKSHCLELTVSPAVSFDLCESVTITASCRDGLAPMQDGLALESGTQEL